MRDQTIPVARLSPQQLASSMRRIRVSWRLECWLNNVDLLTSSPQCFIMVYLCFIKQKNVSNGSNDASHLWRVFSPVHRFQPRLVPHPSSVLWLLLDLMVLPVSHSETWETRQLIVRLIVLSFALSFDGSFSKNCDKLRMEMEMSVILLPSECRHHDQW